MLKESLREIVACPRCKEPMPDLRCSRCGIEFPEVDGIPILIDDHNSLFRVSDLVEGRGTTRPVDSSKLKDGLKGLIPQITLNVRSKRNFERLTDALRERESPVRVLIIGGAVEGDGMDLRALTENFEVVETDIAFGNRTSMVCDAHDLPFVSGSFDAVIAQAVLEHVVDPFRCVSEIHRVLRTDGIVYAESPFMAQVHLGRYDFLRFSDLAHRRLFRNFEEIDSGATCGTGTALAWSWCYFLQSFASGATGRRIGFVLGSVSGFWLKYFDLLLIDRPGTLDAALSFYFFGERSTKVLSDRELIQRYRGALK